MESRVRLHLNRDFHFLFPFLENFNPSPDCGTWFFKPCAPRLGPSVDVHTSKKYIHTRVLEDKDNRMKARRRKRHSTKNCLASESWIIPETFEFSSSRWLVKIGHYNAICVTDQRTWRERARKCSSSIEKQGLKFTVKCRTRLRIY